MIKQKNLIIIEWFLELLLDMKKIITSLNDFDL